MKALEIKSYTAARYSNFRSCDQKYYKFTCDWSVPQDRKTCEAALKDVAKKLKLIAAADAWGTKADTPELIVALASLVKNHKLGADDQQNSFACYQVERYFLRIWYRGTKEQRDALTAKLSPAPASKPATKVAVKGKTATKPAAPKTAPTTKDGKLILHEVEVDDPTAAGLITYLGQFLSEELTADQKRTLVAGLVAALK